MKSMIMTTSIINDNDKVMIDLPPYSDELIDGIRWFMNCYRTTELTTMATARSAGREQGRGEAAGGASASALTRLMMIEKKRGEVQ